MSISRIALGVLFIVFANIAATDAGGATTPIFRNLDPPANEHAIQVQDINNRGFIVGTVDDQHARFTGFFMLDRVFVRIDPVPEIQEASYGASGVDDKGVIVVFGGEGNADPTPFIYADGVFTQIDPLPDGSIFYSEKINTRGYIVGRYIEDTGREGYGVSHGLLFYKGTFTRFDVPSNEPNPTSTNPTDINERGDIVGSWGDISPQSSENHGFRRTPDGRYTTFDVPKSRGTFPTGINNFGHIVGVFLDQSQQAHGFLLINGRFTRIDIPGSYRTTITGINDSDEIVGNYTTPNGGHEYIANALSFRR